jgi:hypothetical protein
MRSSQRLTSAYVRLSLLGVDKINQLTSALRSSPTRSRSYLATPSQRLTITRARIMGTRLARFRTMDRIIPMGFLASKPRRIPWN